MKPKFAILIIAVISQLALGLWPLIPGIKTLLPQSPTEREQLEWAIQITGIGFTLLTACVGLLLIKQGEDARTVFEKLETRFAGPVSRKLRDDEFYRHFLAAARLAENSVCIMYLSPRPPTDTFDEARLAYYQDMLKLIRDRKNVRFSRIVRNSSGNREWIGGLLRELIGCPNAYVCAVKDHDTIENPLSLSTQVIDEKQVWFVALGDHERKGNYRDIHIEGADVAAALQLYYERVWKRGEELMAAGRVTDAGEKFLNQLRMT